jgi:hypothetical protein
MLIAQDLSQHQGVYGKQESITANCHVRFAFAAIKPETAELLSQMAGDTTVSHKQISYRGGRFDLVMDYRDITRQEVRRRGGGAADLCAEAAVLRGSGARPEGPPAASCDFEPSRRRRPELAGPSLSGSRLRGWPPRFRGGAAAIWHDSPTAWSAKAYTPAIVTERHQRAAARYGLQSGWYSGE